LVRLCEPLGDAERLRRRFEDGDVSRWWW
jgi:hypothetical protein